MTKQVTPAQLRSMQQLSLDMYEKFAEFCDRHSLQYFVIGGGLIGALRHGGFIPWDDDLDVFMPRADYERFGKLWRSDPKAPYTYVRTSRNLVTGDLMAKLCDESTTLVTTYQQDIEMPQGFTFDILPIDGCPTPGSAQRKEQKALALVYSLYNSQTVPKNHGWLKANASRTLLNLLPGKAQRYSVWRYCEKRMSRWPIATSDYVTELCAGPKYMQNEYPAEWFASSIMLPFENIEIRVPVGYRDYLSMAFGNWRELPPKHKQKPPHDVAFIDLDTPYSEYTVDGKFVMPA